MDQWGRTLVVLIVKIIQQLLPSLQYLGGVRNRNEVQKYIEHSPRCTSLEPLLQIYIPFLQHSRVDPESICFNIHPTPTRHSSQNLIRNINGIRINIIPSRHTDLLRAHAVIGGVQFDGSSTLVGYPDEEIERGEAEVKAIAFACCAGGRAEHVLYAGYGGGVYLPSVGGGEEEGKGKEVVGGHDCWSGRSWG